MVLETISQAVQSDLHSSHEGTGLGAYSRGRVGKVTLEGESMLRSKQGRASQRRIVIIPSVQCGNDQVAVHGAQDAM